MRVLGRSVSLVGVGWAVLVAAAVAAATGAVARPTTAAVLERVWPVLLFLLLVKLASDLVDATGLFDLTAHVLARAARGSSRALLLLFVGVCVAVTSVLSLDATAVLLAPVAVALAAELDLPPAPFALAALWLANTGSLLLPVANLTNLLAQERSGWHAATFAAYTWRMQVAVVAVTVVVLLVLHRRALRTAYDPPTRLPPVDAVAGTVAVTGLVAFAASVVAGVPPWLGAACFVTVLAAVMVVRGFPVGRPDRLVRQAPWGMAAFALGLFVLVGGASDALGPRVAALVGSGEGFLGLLRVEAVAAGVANLANNLPAYLALEPAVDAPSGMLALLVGVNAGPLILPWGSLATLLWLTACRERGLRLPLRTVVGRGLVLVPVVLLAGAATLALLP